MSPAVSDPPVSRLLHPSAVRFLISDVASSGGRYLVLLAVSVWIQEETGSVPLAGLSMFFFAAGGLLAPLTGSVVDRMSARSAFIGSSIASAAVLPLMLVSTETPVLPVVYAVGFLYGVAASMTETSQNVLLEGIFDADHLVRINALHQTISRGLRAVGPLMGVGLLVLTSIAVTVAVVSCLLLIACLFAPSGRSHSLDPRGRDHSLVAESRRGLRMLMADPLLRGVVLAASSALFFLNFFESVGLQIVTQGLDRPPGFLAPLITVQGVCAIVSGLMLARVGPRLVEGRILATGLVLFLVAALLEATGMLWLVVLGMALAGLGLPWCIVGTVTTVQKRVPRHDLGKVFGAVQLLLALTQTLGVAAGAGMAATFDYRVSTLTIAAGLLLTIVIFASSRSRMLSRRTWEIRA